MIPTRAIARGRHGVLGVMLALAACAAPTQQAAPAAEAAPTQRLTLTPPAMPYACDLEAVPIGSWAEYEQRSPGLRMTTERKAAVARGPEGITIETTRRDFPGFVVALLLDPGKPEEGRLKRATFQDGNHDPMDSPVDERRQNLYRGLNAKTLLGEETVTVRAGTFRTKRYRYKTAFDEIVDVWIDESIWPICLIKLEGELKQGWPGANPFIYELMTTGTGATPKITRPAIPFNIEILKTRGASQGAGTPAMPPANQGNLNPR